MRNGWVRALYFSAMNFMVPGIVAHYLVRKRGIEKEALNSLEHGASQVVVLGAGFDTLAWRLHEKFPHVNFIELDHPATQLQKRRAFAEARNFHYGQVDLERETLRAALANCPGFVHGVATVFVAEGLTMYLREERVAELFKGFAELAGANGRVILSFMEADENGSINFRAQRRVVAEWLRWRREPFLWGIRREELSAFLNASGLGNAKVTDDVRLRAEFLAPCGLVESPLAQGECLCFCSPLA